MAAQFLSNVVETPIALGELHANPKALLNEEGVFLVCFVELANDLVVLGMVGGRDS